MAEKRASSDCISVRELDRDELAEALEWRMEVLSTVFAPDEPWDHGPMREANEAYLDRHLGADLVCCIASIDGEDAGCGAMCLQSELPSPDNPTARSAYLMNIYTRDACRRQGVGAAVVAWLVDKAKGLGVGKIYLESTEAGHGLYESAGFEDMAGMMKFAGESSGINR